jgi:hypothetical protein
MSKFASITPAVALAVGISLVGGGLAGAVFTWLIHQPSPAVVTYSITTTSTGTDSLVKGLVPNLKLKIGDEDIPVVYTHVVELATVAGEYVDAAELAITFPSGLRILGFDAKAPSPVHHIECKQVSTGLTCRVAPLSVGNKYRVNIATNQGQVPQVVTSSRNTELIALDAYVTRESRSVKALLLSRNNLLAVALGVVSGFLASLVWRLFHLPFSVVGRVVNSSGAPVVAAAIRVSLKEPEKKSHNYLPTVTDKHGDFICGSLRKYSLKGTIYVQHPGYESIQMDFDSPIIMAVLKETKIRADHNQQIESPQK